MPMYVFWQAIYDINHCVNILGDLPFGRSEVKYLFIISSSLSSRCHGANSTFFSEVGQHVIVYIFKEDEYTQRNEFPDAMSIWYTHKMNFVNSKN